VLGKFADLPHEAEDEIRGLDEARRRIAELERQIKSLKGAGVARQIDQVGIERAVKSAVERERVVWRQKWEQGRARFRRIVAAAASAEQPAGKLKELLEDTNREWLSSSAAVAAPDFSANHHLARATRPVSDQVTFESLDGPDKLSSGERRILTALAQHQQGRSKVQVAVLTGYAATGGGFNNYLGALRSHGLIQGDGDKLNITEAGIQALGSWDPLPMGSALIDHWRSRLGKAERLILETPTQVYPAALSKEEVAAQAGYEASGGGFNNALGRLRTLELVHGRSELRASQNLFDSTAG